MRTIHVEAHATAAASPTTVWGVLAHTVAWPDWAPQEEAALERRGALEPDGVGAIRVFRTGRVRVREEVTVFEPGRRFGYHLLSGLPLRDYDAEVELLEVAGTTEIAWRASFRGAYPGFGFLARPKIHAVLVDCATRLAAEAARLEAVA